MSDVTQLLDAMHQGNATADDLLPLVYDELRKLAAHKMAKSDHITLAQKRFVS